MPSPDTHKLDEQLSAYLDGELRGREKAAVESLLSSHEPARRRLEELRTVVSLVAALPRHRAPESILADITAAAERSELLGDVRAPAPTPAGVRRARWGWLAAAAALALLVTSGTLWLRRPGQEGVEVATLAQRGRDGEAGSPMMAEPPPTSSPEISRVAPSRAAPAVESQAPPPAETLASASDSPALTSLGYVGDEDLDAALDADSAPGMAIHSSLATLDQKLAAGVGDLERHAFGNETFQLSASFANARARDAALEALAAALNDNGGRELDRGAAVGANESVYLRGRAGVNFRAADDEKQILVRVPQGRLTAVLDQLGRAVEAPGDVVLAAGPIQAVGAERIRSLVDARSRPAETAEPRQEFVMRDEGRSGGLPASPAEDAIRTLAKVLGPEKEPGRSGRGEVVPPVGAERSDGAAAAADAADTDRAAVRKPPDAAKDKKVTEAVDGAGAAAVRSEEVDANLAGAESTGAAAPTRTAPDDLLEHESLAKRRLEELRRRRAAEAAAGPESSGATGAASEPASAESELDAAATEGESTLSVTDAASAPSRPVAESFGAPLFPTDAAAVGPPVLERRPTEPFVTVVVRLVVKPDTDKQSNY